MYSQKVMDHFQNPKNMGEMADANGVGTVGNPKCGDVMKLNIKVGLRPTNQKSKIKNQNIGGLLEEEYIEDIKFQTLGCAAAIACSSATTEMVKGKTIEEALKLTNKDVVDELGELPPAKKHCSVLAEQAIAAAIADYKSRK